MRFRVITIMVALAALAGTFSTPRAEAAVGPVRIQKLAQRQTDLLLSHYQGTPQPASPMRCNDGQEPTGHNKKDGVFLLPTLSFGSGDVTFKCTIKTRSVLVDLGGAIASEDNDPTSTWKLESGKTVRFTRSNLERICDDIIAKRIHPSPAPATVDKKAIKGVRVSTPPIIANVHPNSGSFWRDSDALGHPGKLAASFCGWKAEVHLRPGRNLIRVNLTAVAGSPTHFLYDIKVEDGKD